MRSNHVTSPASRRPLPPERSGGAALAARPASTGARQRSGEPDHSAGTRLRLLDAAGQVFAEQGYRAGTVRDICRLAGANVAAVNYHFRDKEGLYRELLTHAYEASLERHPPDLGVRPGDPPRVRLHAFVRSFLLRLLDEGRTAWHSRLMCREVHEPSPFLGDAVRGSLRRVHEMLKGIVADIAVEARPGRAPADDELIRCAMSVTGQCLHYRFARPVLQVLYPQRFGPGEVDRLAEHITAFSAAGVEAIARSEGRRATARREPRRAAARTGRRP